MKTKSFKARSIAVLLTTALLLVALPVSAVFALTSSEIIPTANGTYTAWTNGVATVDEGTGSASCGSAEFISTITAGARESLVIPLTSIPDGVTITSVNVLARDRGDTASGGTYATFVRFNGVNSADSSSHTATGTSGTACTGSVNDAFDVADAVKNGSTTLEIGVVKLNTTSLRVGVLSATITYSVDSSGGTDAGLGTDDSGVGTVTWAGTGNITADDSSYATAVVPAAAVTHYLQATDYGFNIPSGSIIYGIQATIGKFNTGGTGEDIQDNVVSLIKAGAIVGDNKAEIGTNWSASTSATSTYGSSTDLWGTAWTVDDINASNFGLALAATNAELSTTKTASVDYMKITVYYELPATTTSVDCVSNTITFGESSTCTATVTRSAGSNTPAGSVSFITDASGNFVTSPCTLSGSGASASCSVTYTPSAVGDGTHLITATYAGNSNFRGSNGNQTVTVNKIATSLSITNSPVTYNDSAQPAVVVELNSVPGTISDIKYNGFTTPRTGAGTYAVTADFVPTDPNYASLSDASAGNFVINKANPDCSTIAGYNIVYDGISHPASGSCQGVGNDGTLAILNLGPTTHLHVGTYTNNPWYFNDVTGNYNDATGFVSSTITKANPNCSSIAGYNVTYDDTAHTASGSCQGVGSDGTLTGLNLTFTTHTNAGTFIEDNWYFFDVTGNYFDASGTVDSSIAKANPDCSSITAYNVTYDATSHTATGTCQGVGGDGTLTGLYLGNTTHTTAGNYNDTWLFADATGNYNDANGILNNVIAKANATINITPYSVTYNGSAHTATGTATGLNSLNLSGLLDLSGTIHTNAGVYNNDPWSFAGNTNYNAANGTVNDNIDKANATIDITPYDVTYDGTAYTATGTATGVNSEDLSAGLDLNGTTHTNAGSYNGDTWTFTDAAGNYNDANGTVDDNIAKANATINITAYDETYDSLPHTATGTATGINSEDLSGLLDLSNTTHTNANVYDNDPWSFAGNANYNSANGTVSDNIAKTDANCSSIAGYNVTYDTSSHTASGSCQGVGSDGTLTGLNLSATTHTNAGIYNNDAWSFTNSNYNSQNGTVNSSIAKANATIVVTPYNVTYDATAHTTDGSATGVNSEALTGLDLSATTHTNAGTYNNEAWTFTNPNYNDANGTVNNSIAKANPDCSSITGYIVVFDGSPHTATGSCQGVGGDGTLTVLDLSQTTHTNVGVYNGDPWTFTDASGNYNDANGTVDNEIATTQFVPTLSVTNTPVTYNATPQAANVEGSVSGTVSDVKYDGSSVVPTNAGIYNVTADFMPTDTINYVSLDDGAAGSFVIDKLSINVIADNKSKITTDPDYEPADFTFTYNSLVGSDVAGDIDTPPTCDVAEDQSVPGTYDIVCSGGLDNNYTFTYTNGTLTVNPAPTTTSTFTSTAAHDGWLLESGENTNTGGTMSATGSLFYLGDNAQKKQYRSILSFSTASLPDNAVITKVTLKVKQHSAVNAATPGMFQGFVADIKTGPFGGVALALLDFKTVGSKTVGPSNPVLTSGWYSINLTPGKSFINKLAAMGGITQMRLRFKLDDNNNTAANYVKFFSGNAAAASRPQLIIEWHLP